MPPETPVISAVVMQHQEMAATLHGQRTVLVDAPHARLRPLGRLDERLRAHVDGLSIAGPAGTRLCGHASKYLTLLQPGSPLFDTAAPTWRQQRRIAEMAP
jgi:hypothetical protein